MVITLEPELEAALTDAAKKQGLPIEDVVLKTLRERYLTDIYKPQDEWGRRLLALASDCGVSLSNEALSREEMYD